MTPVETGLVLQLGLAAVAVVAALAAPQRARSLAAGGASVALGVAGAVTGALVLGGGTGSLEVPLAVAPGLVAELTLAPDRLGGLFMILAAAVSAVAALFGIGYAHGPAASRTGWTSYALFVLGLQLVPAAGDVVAFLFAWELMAIGSTVLLFADHDRRAQVRSAGLWYAVMTHLSFLLLLAGFAVLGNAAGSTQFSAMAHASVGASAASGPAFVLLTLGFATKAGVVPMHVWLPRAHPEAPSHVSAVMSAAMVKMGVYGVLLTVTRLMPDGPQWWGLLLLALALPSALYGILQASVASDLKRLLAYSTTENVGLILTAVAISMLARASGAPAVAGVALVAALMLAMSHAAFKTVLFLGAGAILHATGERDLDRLGGLAAGMPVTSAAFAVAALGAAALPVTSGFAAEWVLLQALIHGHGSVAPGQGDRLTTALLPAAVAVVALTAGLALMTFVKAYGIAFLARPRSAGAAAAREPSVSMRMAMLAGAAAVLGLGLAPGLAAAAAASAVGTSEARAVGMAGVDLPGLGALLDPMALTLLGAIVTVPVLALTWALARRQARRPVDLPWGCGGVRVGPRMQYTATSFAEPLVRVFDDALQPTRDLQVTHVRESRYLVEEVRYRQSVDDIVEHRVYVPLVRLLDRVGDAARSVQNGSIYRYLGFSFAALVLILLVVVR
ncbi:MAG TPA: proton-conducting transporter membrane subunit [Candidatus Lustribacter sp.]|nr:proton-conducting transporter membrane subunit [Candidatus Lustribacter sp.]